MSVKDPSVAARRGLHPWWGLALCAPLAGAAVCWWLTAPLEEAASPALDPAAPSPGAMATIAAKPDPKRQAPEFPDWPEGRLEGDAAKRLLLDTLLVVRRRFEAVAGYTAVFRKQERIDGVLGPEQVMEMKLRNRPFAVYFKYRSPSPGKEVVYAEGHHDNKIIAHSTGVARLLVPRLAVPPDHPLALADTRHAITEAGLANLLQKLIGFREMDLDDPKAVTILDRTRDADGRTWLQSVHLHPEYDPRRPFTRVEVRYDPETRLPLQIENYDWPAPGSRGEPPLAERYAYEDLNLNAALNALDFDPANPAYAFHRY